MHSYNSLAVLNMFYCCRHRMFLVVLIWELIRSLIRIVTHENKRALRPFYHEKYF